MISHEHRDGGEAHDRIPAAARAELSDRGYDREYFARAAPSLWQTVLNVYVKLSSLDLWRFVDQESDSDDGCLHFRTTDLDGLRAALRVLGFTRPGKLGGFWDSRERRARCSLHIKHFAPWPDDRIQAHIDVFGAVLRKRWWLFPPVPLGVGVLHLFSQRSYLWQDHIAKILIRQGFDRRIISPCPNRAIPGRNFERRERPV